MASEWIEYEIMPTPGGVRITLTRKGHYLGMAEMPTTAGSMELIEKVLFPVMALTLRREIPLDLFRGKFRVEVGHA